MNIALPTPLTAYLNSENTTETESTASYFAANAVVHDEGRRIEGMEAIKSWKIASKIKYRYRVEPLTASQDGATVKVRVRLTGDFPGSPAELMYTFVLSGEKIAALEIH
jgi:hypothetical protein